MEQPTLVYSLAYDLQVLKTVRSMFINRIALALRKRDWPTVAIEFLLVVVGVLFALQLDNWNQTRKDQALLNDYLIQLQADLRQDIRLAEWRLEMTSVLDERAAYFRAVIDGTVSEPIDHDLLVSSILTAGYAHLNLVTRQTYDDLISTGNLRLFLDSELKREVVDSYTKTELATQWNRLIQSVQIDYRRETRTLLTAEQFRWARKNLSGLGPGAPPVDMALFRKRVAGNDELLGTINAMAEIQERIRQDTRATAKYAALLLEHLEKATQKWL